MSLRALGRATADEGGQAIVLIAAVFLGLLLAMGLAIDTGQLFVARRTAQEAADAAAYAGAVVLYEGGTQTQALAAATTDAATNGYSQGGDGGRQTVTVMQPTASPYNTSQYVQVDITVNVPTSIIPQSGLTTVKVHAIAGAVPLNNGFALMALDRGNTPNAIQVASNGHVHVSGAGILVNSTSSTAAYNNNGDVTVSPQPSFGTQVAGGTSGTWPNPTTGAAQQPDPFAGYPKPSTSGMTVYSSLPGGNPINLSPGIYTVPIQAAGGTTINLASGIYILKAGINGSGNADLVSLAGGVFIFNTVVDYPTDTGGGCGAVNLSGNVSSSLSPLTTGTYAGLLFYQDPACTAQFTISGNGSLSASGTIYVPTGQFQLNGSNATLTGSQLIARTINAQNGTIGITFNTANTAQPKLPRLAQ